MIEKRVHIAKTAKSLNIFEGLIVDKIKHKN